MKTLRTILLLSVICGVTAVGWLYYASIKRQNLNANPQFVASESNCQEFSVEPRMIHIRGGSFTQGEKSLLPEEGPGEEIHVDDFYISATEVTNAQFAAFVIETGYVTEAERPPNPDLYPDLNVDMLVPSSVVFVADSAQGAPGWRVIAGANWKHPFGPGSDLSGKLNHPVVHVSHKDATAYANWLDHRLPTEAEWEFAAKGGSHGTVYHWGDEQEFAQVMGNVWQGNFPNEDQGTDGFKATTAPVSCFPPNGYGLYDVAGNVWEWTATPVPVERSQRLPQVITASDQKFIVKGGSFLCSDTFCHRYRPSAWQIGPDDTGASHVGFRTAL